MWGGTSRLASYLIVDHPVMIITCSEMLQNIIKRDFPENPLASMLQRLSSGVLRRLFLPSILVYQLAIVGYLHTRCLWESEAVEMLFFLRFKTKNSEVHFHKSSRPKMFIFTSHPSHRVVSHEAVEVRCAFSLGFRASSKRRGVHFHKSLLAPKFAWRTRTEQKRCHFHKSSFSPFRL